MVDRYDDDLIGSTPALLGVHEVAAFKGQSSPALFRTHLDPSDVDAPLLEALLRRWRRRHETDPPKWADVVLMRSLNMAFHASLMPAASDTTFYDVGRLISLWVSAFEILVHPGGNGHANRDRVFALLEQVPWQRRRCSERTFKTGGRAAVRRTLASWLYQQLYDTRNAFIHGSPLTRQTLILPTSGRNLFEYAAPLYRLALTAFLDLVEAEAMPPVSDPAALGAAIARRIDRLAPQKDIEEALLTSVEPPGDDPGPAATRSSHPSRPGS